jgi:O-antigen/teichoic acid export membrane protein
VVSLARNSTARFAADTSGLVLGMVAGIITARWLGPSGKGLLSAVTFLSGVIMSASLLGLGEAAIVAIGRKMHPVQEVFSAGLTMLVPSALIGIGAMWGASLLEFRGQWHAARAPVLAGCALIAVNLLNQFTSNVLNAREKFVFTSSMLAISSAATLAATWVFVVWARWFVLGGVIASVCGTGVSVIIVCAYMKSIGFSFRPKPNRNFLRFALSFGPRVQASSLLVTAAGRLDLLLVYSLAGQAAAGRYSVALTVGALSSMLPFALSLTSFPRLASVSDEEAIRLSMQMNRIVLAAALIVAAVIAAASPFLIPLAFGRPYRPAVVPGIILLIGGVFGSSQYMLARSRAARGDASLLFRSYFLNTVVMLLLDVLLIPKLDIIGAAFASTLGNLAGLIVSLAGTARSSARALRASEFVPGRPDAIDVYEAAARMLSLKPKPKGAHIRES